MTSASEPRLTKPLPDFVSILWLTLGVLVLLAFTFFLYVQEEKQIDRANDRRHVSLQLAEELRQSSDDLTRMVRTYVVTGDPIYKAHYQEILDIRDGRKPRPVDFQNVYWDLVLEGDRRPRPSGAATPLLDLLRQARFPEVELAKLAEAKANSDALTKAEFAAMQLVETAGPGRAALRERAIAMLHDAAYHQAKASIMRPIEEFNRLMDQRTSQAVHAAESRATLARIAFSALGLLLVLLLGRLYQSLREILGGRVGEIRDHIARLGRGDFSRQAASRVYRDHTVLGWLTELQARLQTSDAERQGTEARLQEAVASAEAASRAKSEFLANMSHEIRTPMNAIMGLSHLLLRTQLSLKQHDYLARIQNSSRLLLGILNDILDLSKIEAGRMDLERADFDLAQVLAQVSDIISVKAKDKGLTVRFQLDETLPTGLVGDPIRIGQVLLNLANNAVKFTSQGWVSVTVAPEWRDAGRVRLCFEVRDSGIGIAADALPRLFQPFTQADSSTTRQYGGTGLGLAICHRLVALMGGEITVESTPGQGSRFSFRLTLPVQAPRPAPEPEVPPLALKGRRVLVVDDEAGPLEAVAELVQALGMSAGKASSGPDAIEAMVLAERRGSPYDVALLDWRMPEMNGMETADCIEHDPRLRHKPVRILVTGHGRAELDRLLDPKQIRGILLKPTNLSLLMDTLEDALAQPSSLPEALAPVPEGPRPSVRPGARLLLAEDNETNLLIAQELLVSEGYQVALARNGREAVDQALAPGAAFDLVLMDVQMPELDGLEATARIREARKDLPILAMTAHALESERRRCLDAGMNDHISKPFEPEDLLQTIQRWLQPRAAQPFDPTGLLARFKGDPVKAGQFLKAMESDLAHRLAGLREAVGAGDALLAGRSAHALKGLPGGIPLPGLREGVLVLEEAIRTDAPWQEPARSLAAGLSRILAGFPRLPLSGGTAGPR